MCADDDPAVPEQRPQVQRDDRSTPRRLREAGREVHDGIIEVVTPQSRWLLDVVRRRFQRCAHSSDLKRAISFGSWTDFRRLDLDGRVLTLEPLASYPIRVVIGDEETGAA
jgi:hypothetical protein